MKGVLWRGCMASLLCLFGIVWRILSGGGAKLANAGRASSPGVGQSWRTQDGDGRQGSKVSDRLVGKIWPCYSYHKLLRLSGGCLFVVHWIACCCPRFCLYVAVLFLWLVLLCLPRPLRGGTAGFRCFLFFSFVFFIVFLILTFLLFHRLFMTACHIPYSMLKWHCVVRSVCLGTLLYLRVYLFCDHRTCISLLSTTNNNRIEQSARTQVVRDVDG